MPAVWSRGTVCPVPHKIDGRIHESAAKKIRIRAHKHAGIWYHVRRQIQESLRSTHRLARLKPGKFTCVPSEARMHPSGCISLSWVTQGFSRASDETREKSAPSFFARDRKEGKGKTSGHARRDNGEKKPNSKNLFRLSAACALNPLMPTDRGVYGLAEGRVSPTELRYSPS